MQGVNIEIKGKLKKYSEQNDGRKNKGKLSKNKSWLEKCKKKNQGSQSE